MLSITLLLLILCTGYLVIYQFLPKVPSIVQLAAGWVLGVIIFSWLSFMLIAVSNFGMGLTAATVIMAVLSGLLFFKYKPSWTHLKRRSNRLSLAIYILLWGLLFGWLFYSHMFQPKENGWYSGGSAWGDMALHAGFINKFANQTQLDLTSPIYAQLTTNYPFFVDYVTALILRGGLSLHMTLTIFGTLTALSLLILMFTMAFKITGKTLTSWLFAILFLSNGGVGVYYFWQDWQSSGQSMINFLLHMELNYANLFDHGIYWTNVVVDSLLPQRGFLIGLAIFCLVIFLWQTWWHQPKNNKPLMLTSLIIGLTPLFHVHTFLALIGVFVWLLGFGWWSNRVSWHQAVVLFLPSLLLAVPQIFWMSNHSGVSEFISLDFGWMNDKLPLSQFWLQNMGAGFLVLLFLSVYFFWFHKNNHFVKAILAPLLLLFVLCNLLRFQPYEYDNMKLMLLSYWGMMLAFSVLLTNWWQKKHYGVVIIMVVVLSITGWLSIIRETYTSWKLASNSEIETAQQIQELTSPDSVFLTSSAHNHPAMMLAGRSVVMGYEGWLWTHGIDYHQTRANVNAIYEGANDADALLAQYQVDYVFIGPNEKHSFEVNQQFFDDNFALIYESFPYKIYQVKHVLN